MKNVILGILMMAISSISLFAQDLSTATYVQNVKVNMQELDPEGLAFDDTGTKMYILGKKGKISEYHLATANNIVTAVFFQSVDVSSEEANCKGIVFNKTGTKMYIVGQSGDDVNEYTLATTYDISTAVYQQKFSIKAQETLPNDLFFNPTGTKLFILGRLGDDVNEYALSTPFDISTSVYIHNFSVATEEVEPTGLTFNNTGTKLYITGTGTDHIQEYTLTNAYDISTASFSQNLTIKSKESNSSGLVFNADNTQLFVIGKNGDAVSEFSIVPDLVDPDNDGDNVPASIDCNDNDANLTTVGATCDDGDSTTENDVVSENCTCTGTPSNGGTGLTLWTNHEEYLSYHKKILIGTTTKLQNGFGLYVEEGILAEKVKVALEDSGEWADYVFEEDYNLRSIIEVEAFIKENKHLPNVPSAKEVVNTGIDVAKMDATLLQQIEELWLHVIELKKENEALKSTVNSLLKKE